MPAKNEDVVPAAFPYAWDKTASAEERPLKDFLAKYKPSMVQDDGTKPWLWVKAAAPSREDTNADAATEEAIELLKEITKRVDDIKNDESIPVRANKKKGLKSKKELREEVQHEATEKLKAISTKHGFVSGKWLMFAPADKVDVIWNSIATSLVEGPLSSTCAHLTKVATSPREEHPNYQHVLCLYIPDVYDKDSVTTVMRALLRNHGVNLSGVKSNLYTAIGLDSKHPSGIQSTVWKNTALMSDAEMKALKDEYFAALALRKASGAEPEKAAAGGSAPQPKETNEQKETKAAAKPKLKKKAAANDDPFASEDDAAAGAETKPGKPASGAAGTKKGPSLRKKSRAEPVFTDDEDDEQGEDEGKGEKKVAEEVKKKPSVAAKKAAAGKARKRTKSPSDEDEDEDERPRKTVKRGGKK